MRSFLQYVKINVVLSKNLLAEMTENAPYQELRSLSISAEVLNRYEKTVFCYYYKFRKYKLERLSCMQDDLLFGRNPVLEALESGRPINRLLLQEGLHHGQIGRIRTLAKEKGIRYQISDKRRLDQLTENQNHQGVVAFCAAHAYCDLKDILHLAEQKNEPPFVVLCDGITDPHNLGSIIRSANAAGVHGIVIPKNRTAMLNATVSKVSAGAVEHMLVAKVANLGQAIEKLKKSGLWIAGTDLSASQTHWTSDLTGPLGLVIGSEGEGISRIVRNACDFLIKIPMADGAESLNASVAAGILLFESVRQRKQKKEKLYD